MIGKLIFKLCPVHRKCAQGLMNMEFTKCSIMKRCIAQSSNVATRAFGITITGDKEFNRKKLKELKQKANGETECQ